MSAINVDLLQKSRKDITGREKGLNVSSLERSLLATFQLQFPPSALSLIEGSGELFLFAYFELIIGS